MKRVLLILAICLALSLVSGSGASAQKMIRIGEHQIVSHPALDDDGKGFAAALAEEGFVEGKNLTINRQNAQGDQANCAIIARKFEDDKVDLIHAISTPNAQATAKITKTIPVVFSSVTDPVATGIVPKMGKTGTNIYNPGDVNVTFHIKEMKEAVEKMGGKLIEAHVATSADVMQAAQSLVGRVQALHISSDNTTVSAFESVVKVCNENKIPLFVGDTGSVPRGAIAAYGLDYFLIGYTAGKQAAKILKGEKPGEVPAGMASGYSLWINLKAAQLQGAKIDKATAEKAANKLWDEQGNLVQGK
ncbi:MAG: transporter substrate-binding protein [Deltaproteobacteria bacterium]|nr:transporter substrate-binding protein [Deltaproteobacteria bacterium]